MHLAVEECASEKVSIPVSTLPAPEKYIRFSCFVDYIELLSICTVNFHMASSSKCSK